MNTPPTTFTERHRGIALATVAAALVVIGALVGSAIGEVLVGLLSVVLAGARP